MHPEEELGGGAGLRGKVWVPRERGCQSWFSWAGRGGDGGDSSVTGDGQAPPAFAAGEGHTQLDEGPESPFVVVWMN